MDNAQKIWDRLISAGLTPAGAAGLMGNLYAESGLNPRNLQNSFEKKLGFTDETYTVAVDNGTYTNFVHDGAGYGLAEWTNVDRKRLLLAYAKARGRSVGDLDKQLLRAGVDEGGQIAAGSLAIGNIRNVGKQDGSGTVGLKLPV